MQTIKSKNTPKLHARSTKHERARASRQKIIIH